ncbi:hypothetical protein [Pseudoalteromonas sp. SCQQ13]|uniref:hypothetical protein n=1 Tax=Pseudoalteromonas sp. SCQQ13 TaxID=2792066 RepID=UPI0018CF264C|nr:hypothetical protein [Pseudoalteromonas sp. SCQQ13]MBH0093241.1 hypothetical protein [Pseudoalteromonas sp. SCQQ13]
MKAIITATLCVFSTQASFAETTAIAPKSSFDVSADAAVGVLNNSALSVQELDDISSKSDSGVKISTGATAKWQVSKAVKLTSSYRFEQQNYDEFDQYDLDLHQYGVDGSYSFNSNELGLRYDGAKANVAGDTFLHFNQVSAYYGRFLSPQTYLRMSVKNKTKRFASATARDADGVGADIGLYNFINDGQTMLMASIAADKEDAQDSQFDFSGYTFNTKITHKFTALNLSNKVGLGWRYQNKNYEEQTSNEVLEALPSRDEHRNVVNVFWHLDLFKHIMLVTEAEYGDYESKQNSNTYTQSIVSASIKVHF